MTPIDQTIVPGISLGPLRLGIVDDEVEAIIGKPSEVRCVDYGDGKDTFVWHYNDHGIVLAFSEEDGFRLGSISTENPDCILAGVQLIGLNEDELLTRDFESMGPPILDEDFEEQGRCYEWDAFSISCWVDDETACVVGVDLMPFYDESGDIPQWPEA